MDALGISRTDVPEAGFGDSHRSLVAYCRASRDPLVDPNANFAADAVIDIRLPDGQEKCFWEPARSSESTPSSCLIAVGFTVASADAQTTAPGGFMDSATSAGLRAQFSAGEIQTFLPRWGTFRFPSPYFTQGVRVTNASDCGGTDCVRPVGYSYWSNINNHVGSDTMLIFLGLERRQGGGGPRSSATTSARVRCATTARFFQATAHSAGPRARGGP